MTKACHARQDRIRGLRPHKRFGASVGELDIPTDGDLQLAGTAMHAAAQLLLRERREPALHEIDPRTPRRREVHMEARVPGQPAVDQGRLVGTCIVDNEMDVERIRDRRVNGLQERAELAGPVALVELADDLAARSIQGGEQRRRPVRRV